MFQTKDINIWRHFSMEESLTFHRNLECVYFRFLGSLRAGPLKSNFFIKFNIRATYSENSKRF